MTFLISVIGAAAFLPYLMLLLSGLPARAGEPTRWGPGWDNHNPRASMERLQGFRRRAHHAQLNGHEAFAPFAIAALLAHLAATPARWFVPLCLAFLGLRIAYGAFYVFDRPRLRSAAWWGGALCVLGLFVAALVAA